VCLPDHTDISGTTHLLFASCEGGREWEAFVKTVGFDLALKYALSVPDKYGNAW